MIPYDPRLPLLYAGTLPVAERAWAQSLPDLLRIDADTVHEGRRPSPFEWTGGISRLTRLACAQAVERTERMTLLGVVHVLLEPHAARESWIAATLAYLKDPRTLDAYAAGGTRLVYPWRPHVSWSASDFIWQVTGAAAGAVEQELLSTAAYEEVEDPEDGVCIAFHLETLRHFHRTTWGILSRYLGPPERYPRLDATRWYGHLSESLQLRQRWNHHLEVQGWEGRDELKVDGDIRPYSFREVFAVSAG